MNVPDHPEFTKLRPFFALSRELSFDIVLSFYLKQYAVSKGMEIYKKLKSEGNDNQNVKESINEWIAELENLKKTNVDEFLDREKNLDHIEESTQNIFLKCDDEERENKFTRDTIKGFQAAARLYEIIEFFGRKTEESIKKRKYALAKAIEINKKLKNIDQAGNKPNPNKMEDEFPTKGNSSNSINNNSLNAYEKNPAPCQESVMRILDFVKGNSKINYDPQPVKLIEEFKPPIHNPNINSNQSSSIRINLSNIREKIRKECENASNSLNVNKIEQAKIDLMKALEFIQQYKKIN